jgi:hypothetical protein
MITGRGRVPLPFFVFCLRIILQVFDYKSYNGGTSILNIRLEKGVQRNRQDFPFLMANILQHCKV